MTSGRARLDPQATIYESCTLLLWDEFRWEERKQVVDALKRILAPRGCPWKFGGAYLFYDTLVPRQVLYIGETDKFGNRIRAHLMGPARKGNRHDALKQRFAGQDRDLGLALLVVTPDALPVLDTPDGPAFEDGIGKLAAEGLEALALRGHLNWKGVLPILNDRRDQARAHGDANTVRFQSLVRFLFDADDATRDFPTFRIRGEEAGGLEHVQKCITRCKVPLKAR